MSLMTRAIASIPYFCNSRNMENDLAVKAFSALGQGTRLNIFRMLLHEGPSGLPAGQIGSALNVPASTMSAHLSVLEAAGLIRSHRVVRQIFYAADIEGTRRLLGYLTEDCCGGRPEICGGLGEAALLGQEESEGV